MLAASKGNAPLLMLLLNRGADPDYVHEYNVPQPALHYAVRENQIRATKVLLTHGANPNIKTAKGVTPFETAVKLCHFDIASLLIKNGAIAISQKFNTNALTEILDRCKRSQSKIEQSDSYNNFLQVYSNTQSQDSLEDKK